MGSVLLLELLVVISILGVLLAMSAPSKKLAEDLLITLCGLTTCVLTAVTLWWVETKFGFARHNPTLLTSVSFRKRN